METHWRPTPALMSLYRVRFPFYVNWAAVKYQAAVGLVQDHQRFNGKYLELCEAFSQKLSVTECSDISNDLLPSLFAAAFLNLMLKN